MSSRERWEPKAGPASDASLLIDQVTDLPTVPLLLEGMRKHLEEHGFLTILSINVPRWREEMAHREEHLSQFERLPEEIWEAHRRVASGLDELG